MRSNSGVERLRAVFAADSKALVPYITAGDPDLEVTGSLLTALAEGGADIIELGIPFSDPMADGPVLQLAAERALENAIDMDGILATLAAFTAQSDVPVILFGYYNPFFRYGHERLARAARVARACGVLCVDLPPEEAGPFLEALRAEGLALIPLLTPVSGADRVARAAAICDAFGYYVSATGVTGLWLEGRQSITERVTDVRAALARPLVVGFGVRTPDDATRMALGANGVVVGSALVQLAHDAPADSRADAVRAFTRSLKTAITPLD